MICRLSAFFQVLFGILLSYLVKGSVLPRVRHKKNRWKSWRDRDPSSAFTCPVSRICLLPNRGISPIVSHIKRMIPVFQVDQYHGHDLFGFSMTANVCFNIACGGIWLSIEWDCNLPGVIAFFLLCGYHLRNVRFQWLRSTIVAPRLR